MTPGEQFLNTEKAFIVIRKNIDLLKAEAEKMRQLAAAAKATKDPKLIAKVEKGHKLITKAWMDATEKFNNKQAQYWSRHAKLSKIATADLSKKIPKDEIAKNISFGGLNNLQLLAVGAVAFTGITTSIVLYKRFFSKAAKACKGRKGIDRQNCVIKFKIAGYEASIKSLQSSLTNCSQTNDPFKCKNKMQDKLLSYSAKIRKFKKKLNEDKSMDFINGYIEYLNEDRGLNLPIERDDKPNYIRFCMMRESDRLKIGCLRKLKELTAMNPFYQYRIDRFIDAITDTYEPTKEPGFHEYKEES